MVGEILAAPTAGPVSTIGMLYVTGDGAALVDELRIGADGAMSPLDDQGIWLGWPAGLPAEARRVRGGEARSMVVELSGSLVGPGQYGLAGQYAYTIDEPVLKPLDARDLTIPLLLGNSDMYEGLPVRLRGHLLASSGTALLIERIGEGGIPDERALQVKLAALPRDPTLIAALHASADGRAAFGPVEITGLWRGGRLYPLAATPR